MDRIGYGDDPNQFGDLALPAGTGPFPVVVFIHGGFWRNRYRLALSHPQADDAVHRGYAAWNIEYRRVGDSGGGFPGTLADVAAAVDHVASLAGTRPLDLSRVAVVGHSAGGHLAFWIGQRSRLEAGVVGADPGVVPRLVVGQAPVAALAANLDLGDGAVRALMGATPSAAPERYAIADPAQLLPVDVPQLIVHGTDDADVPVERSAAYAAAVDDPDRVEVVLFDGADHFAVIDPAHESWAAVVARLP